MIHSQQTTPMRQLTDQMGRVLTAPVTPQRVVSLVPSQTELLFDLGLDQQVAGVTRYCLYPQRARQQSVDVGGTKRPRLQTIQELKPDLIIGNKEENDQASIEQLATEFPVWMSDIYSLNDALSMVCAVGDMMGAGQASAAMAQEIRQGWDALPDANAASVAYLIWKKPYMACGNNTFIQAVLQTLGFHNVFDQQPRYPEVSVDDLKAAAPNWVFLSSEPFPFTQVHVDELAVLLPRSQIILVDGEMFSWYGSRLLLAPAYFSSLLSRLQELSSS